MNTQKDIRDIRNRVNGLDISMAALQQEVKGGFRYIGEEIKDMKKNHLHTLEVDMRKMRIKLAKTTLRLTIVISIAVFIISVLVNLAFVIFFK